MPFRVDPVVDPELRTGRRAFAYRKLLEELAAGPVFSSAVGRAVRMREALDAGEPFEVNEEWVQPLL